MPFRLIGFILMFAVFLLFIAFNLRNACDINLIFKVFPQVPVYLTALTAFALGMLCAMPFLLSFRLKKRAPKEPKADKKDEKPPKIDDIPTFPPAGGPYGIN